MSIRCGAGNAVLSAKDAIAMHMRWRITLQLAIARREPLSPAAVRAIKEPNECCIGVWLLSSRTRAVRHTPQYLALVARHLEFHREMLEIATQIANRNFAAANRALDPGNGFQRASLALATALTAFDLP
ncbi:MAG: hypothetical protein ABR910_01525 [Acidobacteriaceae bacterium]|jgi:methyl-accepting chemotaxis protein